MDFSMRGTRNDLHKVEKVSSAGDALRASPGMSSNEKNTANVQVKSFSKVFNRFNRDYSEMFSLINDSNDNRERRAKHSLLKPVI